MNPKQTVCERNVNWVNLAQNRINWHPMSTYYSNFGVHTKCPWVAGTNFSCSEITFTHTDVVHFVRIQIGDTHINMQPANLASTV